MSRPTKIDCDRSDNRSCRNRRGMILALVLVAILVVTLLGAALANAFLAQRQLARHNEQNQQAFWLAESALHRAAHRLATEAGYEGETWEVSAEQLRKSHGGIAIVRIETLPASQPGRRIVVEASFPRDTESPSTQHRELLVTISND